jgi:putative FmdB family regulatory protein
MPVYEYYCPTCKISFDELKSEKDRDRVKCPDCGNKPERKLSTFQFKVLDNFHKVSNIASDGEGFTSKVIPKREADPRAKANAGKYN